MVRHYVSLVMMRKIRKSRGVCVSCRTHVFVEVHEVGHDLDVGVVDVGLADDFLQDVTQASREDEDGDVVLLQVFKELQIAIPENKQTQKGTGW